MIILDCGRPADFVSAGQCEHHLCDYRDDCGFQVGMMMVMVGDGGEALEMVGHHHASTISGLASCWA